MIEPLVLKAQLSLSLSLKMQPFLLMSSISRVLALRKLALSFECVQPRKACLERRSCRSWREPRRDQCFWFSCLVVYCPDNRTRLSSAPLNEKRKVKAVFQWTHSSFFSPQFGAVHKERLRSCLLMGSHYNQPHPLIKLVSYSLL